MGVVTVLVVLLPDSPVVGWARRVYGWCSVGGWRGVMVVVSGSEPRREGAMVVVPLLGRMWSGVQVSRALAQLA